MQKAKPPKRKVVQAWTHADDLLADWQSTIRPWLREQYPDDEGIPEMDDAFHEVHRVMRDIRARVEG